MNGLALRISNGGSKKTKNIQSLAAIDISMFISENLVTINENINNFIGAKNVDEQLFVLKEIADKLTTERVAEGVDFELINFLALVFFHTEAKHPIKCFISRYITKTNTLQEPFSNTLADEISLSLSNQATTCEAYSKVLSKLYSCIENFASGSAAVKKKEKHIAEYLDSSLSYSTEILRGPKSKSLSPTEKNEVFNLAHLALRLFLHIVQRKTDNVDPYFEPISNRVKGFIEDLLFDEDVPMDTKSVCGILYLSIHVFQYGPDSWVSVLKENDNFSSLLSIEASKLALYSAVATVVAVDKMQTQDINGTPAIVVLNRQMLAIGERSSSESTIMLGVTRTLVQISKHLDKLTDHSLGLSLVGDLLGFAWSHLEHYMDSVRHLTAQLLGHIVKYCSKLYRQGDPKALTNLFGSLTSLDRSRKSYYVSLTSLINEIGAREVLRRMPSLIVDTMPSLSVQAVQASATTTLETLLQKHVKEDNTDTIYREWVQTILNHVASRNLESGALNILESLLVRAVKLDENIMDLILPHIKQSTSDLKTVLMLLSVARKSGVASRLSSGLEDEWKGIISYEVLKAAAVDAVDETRILSLSLVVESPKSTEVFTKGELSFVLYFLRYNCNAQSPNFRQLVLSMMKKFIKRLEDSYKILKKQGHEVYYTDFVEELRAQCFDSLIPGANYSRRVVALQLLVWVDNVQLGDYKREWKEDYINTLLLHLEDSYENNKAFALDILNKCPAEFIKKKTYSISLEIEDILRQASSMKPTDCVCAAYKLDLLRSKLPEKILEGKTCNVPEAVTFTLTQRLHRVLVEELAICERSIVSAAINAPMYGILHCILHVIASVDVRAISTSNEWSVLVGDIINTCVSVNASVECVVNNSSPEGHLPMDMGGVEVTDHGNSGGVRLEDGRQVTAQMVLLCAWRSVKEVSLLLGEISSRLSILGEEDQGTLTVAQLERVGEHFTKLLAETKHRGAFEQAYVGFTKLLARLWRCRTPLLHSLPRTWLQDLMGDIAAGDKRGAMCATRRSAGLPFMIQALVTTELQVQGNPKCFHQCMTTLLHLARTATCQTETAINMSLEQKEMAIETRTHSINILRALFRNSVLEESVSGYVGQGLVVALEGFSAGTWMERNSSTLLFSALMVRIFGVQRSKDTDNLCVRNRMTGRIFFLRYPHLYDFILNELKEISSSEDTQVLRPSLYPVLLLLARLYPSSLEGTVSNLKLVAYVPHVVSCARSGVLKTRQLAAKAIVPLISPDQYIQHLESMFALICDTKIKKNYCHGILLQLIRLLDARPDSLTIDTDTTARLSTAIGNTYWILEQATGKVPCYLLADEYVKMINLILMRFPTLITSDTANTERSLEKLLFTTSNYSEINSGRDICLANALYLYFVILNRENDTEKIYDTLHKSLSHESYEVTLTALNYLLILYENFDPENKLEEHLSLRNDKNVLKKLKDNSKYIDTLCKVVRNGKYLECKQKSLKLLTLENDTEKFMVETKIKDVHTKITDEIIIQTLISCMENEHENLQDIYLQSLSNFVSKKLKDSTIEVGLILVVLQALLGNSSSDNNESKRNIVVKFLENNTDELFKLNLDALTKEERFDYKATLYAILVTILEDDNEHIRQTTSNIIIRLANTSATVTSLPKVISTRAPEVVRSLVEKEDDRLALFVVLALLDFKSEVCLSDEVSDECRVFDQNERYNIFLEETLWTKQCVEKIIPLCESRAKMEVIQNILQDKVYRQTFEKLCNNNLILFKKMLKNVDYFNHSVMNPKIKIFVDKLLEQ